MSTDTRPAPTPAAPGPPDAGPPEVGGSAGSPAARRRVPPWARWALVVVLVLAFVAAVAVYLRPPAGNENPGDPENVGPQGTAALVAVAGDEGIDLEVVRGSEAFAATELGADTTVVVSQPGMLGERTGAELLDHTSGSAGLVLLAPEPRVLETLGLPVQVAQHPTEAGLAADCDLPLARQDPTLPAMTLLAYSGGGEATACFRPADIEGTDAAGALLALPGADDRAPVSLFGATPILANEAVATGDNAGIALRLLFPSERVVWYVPQALDDFTAAQGVTDVLPDAVIPLLWLLGAAVLALALVQGRRLGPLVRESLPVVVHSTETTVHRSRLYRQARDHQRALAALQSGARRRLRDRLALGPHASEHQIVLAVADRTGRPVEQIGPLLTDPNVPDESTLMSTARRLAELEEEVHP